MKRRAGCSRWRSNWHEGVSISAAASARLARVCNFGRKKKSSPACSRGWRRWISRKRLWSRRSRNVSRSCAGWTRHSRLGTAGVGRIRSSCESRAVALKANRSRCEAQMTEQRQRLLKARKDCRVLEKLKEERHKEWSYLGDREVEETAAESYISSWLRSNADRNHESLLPHETESGCYKWRSAIPGKYLQRRGHTVQVLSNELRGYDAPDALVVSRAHFVRGGKDCGMVQGEFHPRGVRHRRCAGHGAER